MRQVVLPAYAGVYRFDVSKNIRRQAAMGEKSLVFRVIELEDEIKALRFAILELMKYEGRIYEAGGAAAIHLADKALGVKHGSV